MGKELPYFKFRISEWNDGDVTLRSFEAQGLFINICSLYWSKEGKLPLTTAKEKFSKCNRRAFTELIKKGIVKLEKGMIKINFLDEQLQERELKSKKNSENASSRWEKPSILDATASSSHSDENKVALPIEERREEKNREEKKRKELGNKLPPRTLEDRQKEFYNLLTPEVNNYSKKMMRAFYEYWTEKSPKGKKMRFELQKVFDVKLRLSTWAKREGIEPPEEKKLDYSGAEIDFKALNKDAWEKIYDYQLSTDQNFRKHFNYAELREGIAVGSHH